MVITTRKEAVFLEMVGHIEDQENRAELEGRPKSNLKGDLK